MRWLVVYSSSNSFCIQSYVAFISEVAGTSCLGAQSSACTIFSDMTGLFSFVPNSFNTQWFWMFDFHSHYINKPHFTLNFPPPLIQVLIALRVFFNFIHNPVIAGGTRFVACPVRYLNWKVFCFPLINTNNTYYHIALLLFSSVMV